MKKKRLYVDMDDTICEYTDHWHKVANKTGLRYPQSQKGFYIEIIPKLGALTALVELDKIYDVWILTCPSYKNAHCYSEKRIWIENHLGIEWCKKLILCPDKALLKGDFLVDDYEWPDFEGMQLLFGSSEYPNWNVITRRLTIMNQYDNNDHQRFSIDHGDVDDY